MKVVIDTNIWISFFIGKKLSKLSKIFLRSDFEFITSDLQVEEIRDVLYRSKFSKYFTTHEIEELLFLFLEITETIDIILTVKDCRDPKDNFILDIAINGSADYIITGDNDLLVMDPYKGVRIISYLEFEKVIESKS